MTVAAVDSNPAVARLRDEHREMQRLFAAFMRSRSAVRRIELLSGICTAVRLHFTIETGEVMPLLAHEQDGAEFLSQAGQHYASIIAIVNEVACSGGPGARSHGLVCLLRKHVSEHILRTEATDGVLARVSELGVDWLALHHRLIARRAELSAPLGAPRWDCMRLGRPM